MIDCPWIDETALSRDTLKLRVSPAWYPYVSTLP